MPFISLLLLSSSIAAAGPLPHAFPRSFSWCVATAAHQIEGQNTESDWWDFEQLPGKIKRGERSGATTDHWNRLEEDTQLLKDLNVSTYRFSVEWAKIEPQPGQWNREAIAHYRRELSLLRAAGIRPLITLHHFTNPRWFARMGGWESPAAPTLFARFARLALEQIGPDVRDWITFNEPMVFLMHGYMTGQWPPGRSGDMKGVVAPALGVLRAHALAYRAMKALRPTLRIGMAHHLRVFDPPRGLHPLHAYLASRFDQAFNWALAESLETGRMRLKIPFAINLDTVIPNLAHTQDFVGVNYYSRDVIRFKLGGQGFTRSIPKDAALTDMGWEIYPHGFYRILKAAARRFPGKPIIVTENGLADASDAKRPPFLYEHLRELQRAMDDGVPVEGYCHWSLLDNFEWAEGFSPRFGLYEVDYATFARRPRESARIFSEIARTGQLPKF